MKNITKLTLLLKISPFFKIFKILYLLQESQIPIEISEAELVTRLIDLSCDENQPSQDATQEREGPQRPQEASGTLLPLHGRTDRHFFL